MFDNRPLPRSRRTERGRRAHDDGQHGYINETEAEQGRDQAVRNNSTLHRSQQRQKHRTQAGTVSKEVLGDLQGVAGERQEPTNDRLF